MNRTHILHPLTGSLLFLGGLIAYIIEYGVFHIIRTPYSFLIPATAASCILLLSARARRTLLRAVPAIVITGFTLLVWWLVLVAWQTPDYNGPAQPGQESPAFSTVLNDGTTFNTASLKGDSHSLLVFYRGRW